MSFVDLPALPLRVMIETDQGLAAMAAVDQDFRYQDCELLTSRLELPGSGLVLRLELRSPVTAVRRIHLRWPAELPSRLRLLGDHWERAYGDLGWRGMAPHAVFPWYVLTTDAVASPPASHGATHGYGVRVQPAAFCCWRVDPSGLSLWLDVRSGGVGVSLGSRTLRLAEVVARRGDPTVSPFISAQAFCRALCPLPRLPAQPVYGANDWYYSYGASTPTTLSEDAGFIAELSPDAHNRPYAVIDGGWQASARAELPAAGGPWDRGNLRFPDLPGLAAAISGRGARPGIWFRPLGAGPGEPQPALLQARRAGDETNPFGVLDPSIPENLARVEADTRRFVDWGFQLIKHDFSAFDVLGRWGWAADLGRWGFNATASLTDDGWSFADRSRTTAEIVLELYRTIRRGASNAVVIGCNTFSHLSAGLFELNRTGDDTSGRDWERTRKMGINALAFRMPQHHAFYEVDADCVGITSQLPWRYNVQWLDLLARSGTPLFVSVERSCVTAEIRRELRQALAKAATPLPVGEPLDWMDLSTPARWRLEHQVSTYEWFGAEGIAVLGRGF